MPNDPTEQICPKESAAKLLHRLASPDAGMAWLEFLERYSPLIMHVASQFEYEQERINECFLYACEQLNDNGFRRLLKFDTAGKAQFRVWLGAVVFNLCVDWHRREYGRATVLPAIAALPAFDQAVHRMVVEQGMDKEASYQTLRADFPDLTRELVANAVARVYSLLTPRQRWQINVRMRGRKSVRGGPQHGRIESLPDPLGGPEEEAQKQEDLELLHEAMSRLPTNQRLLLRLRFQEGLTLRKIAQLKYHGDTNATWRQIQAAMNTLSGHLGIKSSAKQRKN